MNNGMTEITITCRWCKTDSTIKVDAVGYEMWCSGFGNVQDLLPKSSPEDRELLISQTCNKCWKKMFK